MFFIHKYRTGNRIDIDADFFLNKAAWMNAETLCNSKNRHLSQNIPLALADYLLFAVTMKLESLTFDVWIGLVAALDLRTIQSKQNIFIYEFTY